MLDRALNTSMFSERKSAAWYLTQMDVWFRWFIKFQVSTDRTKRVLTYSLITNILIKEKPLNWFSEQMSNIKYEGNIGSFPDDTYMYQVNNRNTRRRCEICSKLTINYLNGTTSFAHLFLVFLLLSFEQVNVSWDNV